MSTLAAGAVLLLAVIYQIVAGPLYSFGDAGPDFILIAVLYVAAAGAPGMLTLVVLPLSIALDLVSLAPAGTHVVTLLPPLWIIGAMRGWFVIESRELRWLILVPAALLALAAGRLWAACVDPELDFRMPWTLALLTAGFTVPLHHLLDRLFAPDRWRRGRVAAGRS